jgi:phosphohistidine swiveling domain-containing protein
VPEVTGTSLSDATVLHQVGGAATAWTTVNNAEALPGVLTPLTWSFWERPIEVGLRAAFADMGVLPAREVVLPESIDDRSSAVFYGRYAGNVDRMRAYADLIPGTSGDALERQIFGSVRPHAPGRPSRRRWPAIGVRLPVAAGLLPKRLAETRTQLDRWWRSETSSTDMDPARLRALLVRSQARFQEAIRGHILATMLAQATYQQVAALAAAAGREGAELDLTTGYGGLEESLVLHDVWAVAHNRMPLWEFLASHGYHGPSEGEMSSPSWRVNPAALTGTVRSYSELDESQAPAAVQRRRIVTRLRAEADLLKGMSRARRTRARLVLRLAARHIPLREVGKASFLRAIDVGRYAASGVGHDLAERGVLTDPMDAFLLTVAELADPAITANAALVADLVGERRVLRDSYRLLALPEVWSGNPSPITDHGVTELLVGDKLTGLAVCPGVVEGRVQVLLNPDDGDDFDPGDILVCGFTDPGWMMLINLSGAMVIDVGGALSHGAIVARELGIPTVINTVDGTRLLRTGDRVRVDAGAGTVELLARSEAPAHRTER